LAALLASIIPLSATAHVAAGQKPRTAVTTGWTTYHHDNSRNGYDPNAPAFTGGPFGLGWDNAVDQNVYAQPLAIGGRVYVATMGDSVYAFDATTGNQVWARTGASALATPSTAQFCFFNPGSNGIMSTPVIDPSTSILYAAGLTTSPTLKYQLFALHLSDGTNVTGFPVDLGVDPNHQNQRAALALANGHVYAAFGGWLGDCSPYHPTVVSVPTTGTAVDHVYQPQAGCQEGAGIWGASGPAVDATGNLYVATGNGVGCYGPTGFPCDNTMWDHGNGVMKLASTLAETWSWAPDNSTQNWCSLATSDTDVGSIDPVLLPNNELFQTGKSGYGWLLATGMSAGPHFDGQQFQGKIGSCVPDAAFGGQAYYAGRLYVPCDGVGLVAFTVDTAAHNFNVTPSWTAPFASSDPVGPPIAAMGLIWAKDQDATTLYGFDPSTGAQKVNVALAGGNVHFGSLAEDGGWVFAPHGASIAAFNFNAPACATTSSPHWFAGCGSGQYRLSGSDGSKWVPMDSTNLKVSFTPAVASSAVVSANADLWTSKAGLNQDIGVAVTIGPYANTQPDVWKESGGTATFAPNAAFAQSVIPVAAGQTYTATLVWKPNKSDATGTIWAGAGPIGGATSYSPTRISVMLIPDTAATAFKASSTLQYKLTNSDGTTWRDLDLPGCAVSCLTVPFTPPGTSTNKYLAYISGNSDLWTSNLGFNQDIGINLSGGTYSGIVAWKESGGRAGTFSPNAAFAQPALPVVGGQPYTAKLQWKANKAGSSTIYAGAGPIGGNYSPTTLSVVLVPDPAPTKLTASSNTQPVLPTSTGTDWKPMDNTALSLSVTPTSTTNYLLSANSDLWTSTAGFNQDIGIMVNGGAFTNAVVTWKESGGSANLAPNAAFAYGDITLPPGSYAITIVWKANRSDPHPIYAGAGPLNGSFSPTWLTATVLN
jgi:outer membrane protein assembly factor BamB